MRTWVVLTCTALLAASDVLAADRSVKTSDELATALKDSQPGDRVLVAPGEYALSATLAAGPLTIEAADAKARPVITPAAEAPVIDCGKVEGPIVLRGLVFDGRKKKLGAVKSAGVRLEVEDCEFRDFHGQDAAILSVYGADSKAHPGIRVSRCTFRRNPNHERDSDACGAAVFCLGPAVVEDCTLEDMRGGLVFNTWPAVAYKVIVRRNHIYRTEGTDWKCHAVVTRTMAPEVYENLIHDLSKGDCSAMTIAAGPQEREGTPTAALVYRNVIIDRWKAADSGMIHEAIEYGEYAPSKGKIYDNVFVARVSMSPSLYNKGSDNEWFNNTFYGNNRFFHCFGRRCRYYNNIMVGGRADGNYYPKKEQEANKEKVETGTLEYSDFFQVEHVKDREFILGEGMFAADPKFVDPEKLDFHLRCDSPCINKGTGSRDGLTPADLGAFEYPIQVSAFSVDDHGRASWQWANGFQKVSALVRIRWNAERFPESHDGKEDITVADAPAVLSAMPTTKKTGYFAAFVLDIKGRWSGSTPDGVHRFKLP